MNEQIKLSINHEKLKECGLSFESWSDMYYYIKSLVEWLESHNKEILESIDCGV